MPSLAALQATLESAATSTFEDLAFLSVVPWPEDAADIPPLAHAVRVRFGGMIAGHVDVALAGEVLPEVASNMLGTSRADEAMQGDALGELANVICGNTVPVLAGWAAEFPLEAPARVAPDAPALGPVLAETRLWLGEGWALVRLAQLGETPAFASEA